MSKHTPGPWFPVVNAHGNIEIVTNERPYIHTVVSENECLNAADARLIAAAPDMYTLLRDMVEIFEGYDAEADCDPFAAKEFFKRLAEEFLVDAHEILLAVDGETK